MKFKRMKGCHAHKLPAYLDEFMWRERNGCTKMEIFTNIMRDIADFPCVVVMEVVVVQLLPDPLLSRSKVTHGREI